MCVLCHKHANFELILSCKAWGEHKNYKEMCYKSTKFYLSFSHHNKSKCIYKIKDRAGNKRITVHTFTNTHKHMHSQRQTPQILHTHRHTGCLGRRMVSVDSPNFWRLPSRLGNEQGRIWVLFCLETVGNIINSVTREWFWTRFLKNGQLATKETDIQATSYVGAWPQFLLTF